RSTDMGATWAPVTATGAEGTMITDVVFPDNRNGFAVGLYGRVIRTNKAGREWYPPSHVDSSQSLTSVSFPDTTHGWMASANGNIYATTDGAMSWTLQ